MPASLEMKKKKNEILGAQDMLRMNAGLMCLWPENGNPIFPGI